MRCQLIAGLGTCKYGITWISLMVHWLVSNWQSWGRSLKTTTTLAFAKKDNRPERSDWDVTEGLLPVVEIPTLSQYSTRLDERGEDLLLCVASELASEKWMLCKFTECMFLNNSCEKNMFHKLCWRAGNDVGCYDLWTITDSVELINWRPVPIVKL